MRILILLAGFPGTGKSYLAEMIEQRVEMFELISQDKIKESFFDKYGYNNLNEKKVLESEAWQVFYDTMETRMRNHQPLMSDYPFSDKQKPYLEQLAVKYDYLVITIRMTADLDVLFERRKARDLDKSRHLSHIVTTYQKGNTLEDRQQADYLLSYEEFIHRCTTRGYDRFSLGELFEVDTTDYSKVDYDALLNKLIEIVKNRRE